MYHVAKDTIDTRTRAEGNCRVYPRALYAILPVSANSEHRNIDTCQYFARHRPRRDLEYPRCSLGFHTGNPIIRFAW